MIKELNSVEIQALKNCIGNCFILQEYFKCIGIKISCCDVLFFLCYICTCTHNENFGNIQIFEKVILIRYKRKWYIRLVYKVTNFEGKKNFISFISEWPIGIMVRVFDNGPGDWG